MSDPVVEPPAYSDVNVPYGGSVQTLQFRMIKVRSGTIRRYRVDKSRIRLLGELAVIHTAKELKMPERDVRRTFVQHTFTDKAGFRCLELL